MGPAWSGSDSGRKHAGGRGSQGWASGRVRASADTQGCGCSALPPGWATQVPSAGTAVRASSGLVQVTVRTGSSEVRARGSLTPGPDSGAVGSPGPFFESPTGTGRLATTHTLSSGCLPGLGLRGLTCSCGHSPQPPITTTWCLAHLREATSCPGHVPRPGSWGVCVAPGVAPSSRARGPHQAACVR